MASPHICGLLAYLLSLQPASDSAYAVAEISPKELKAHLISIATRNALADISADTPNRKQTPQTLVWDHVLTCNSPCLERWWQVQLLRDHQRWWLQDGARANLFRGG